MAFADQIFAKGLDECAFTNTGNTCDTYADGIAGVGQNGLDNLLGQFFVALEVTLHNGDAPGQDNPVAL